MAPPLPKKGTAAAGGTKPLLASSEVTGKSIATVAKPMAVANANGMVNQTKPPQVTLGGGARLGGDGRLPVRLIDKDGTKVTEDDTALGQHGQERTALVVFDWTAVLVSRDGGAVSRGAGNRFQSFEDLARGADQVVARGVHFE